MLCRLFKDEKKTFFFQNDYSKLALASTLIGQVKKKDWSVSLHVHLFV